ncbi:lytic murein transglycosylase [Roseivivax sediminis]|uniref:Lytic murein transglycosylase n=1 Tax=Roseivivax sediminis TaxID=936889 RepID=A0A1I1THW6_9RHOB|nr:lytic murein transglycosylase [Roseivivax sediminis]SFD56768.1 lytic murein transglycosylase [Roseivivax sediminis]
MTLRRLACLLVLLPTLAWGQDRTEVAQFYRAWLSDTLWPMARAEGVSRSTFDAALGDARLNWDLPDLVPPGAEAAVPRAQRQSEFASPARYFRPNAVQGAAAIGRQMAARHADALAAAERATGVPGRIVLAIWGRESGYGRVDIPHDAFEVLGTKAFMSTRAEYFTEELVALLQIAQAGHAPPGAMKSSWAGALGQPQFMPSSFLNYAADGDGDGRSDIWRSEADTIASIATYLAQHDWVAGRDWGFEVVVPEDVSCALEGPDQGRPIADWAAMGISRVGGKAFPEHELRGEGYLMMPAGRHGPAFVVTPNFYVLKDYNMSDLYALFVGHVGDRIAYGMSDFAAGWGDVGGLYRSDIAEMQRGLQALGHDVGGADGLPGFKTRRSIGRWQADRGETPTCFPRKEMLGALGG